MPHDFPSVINVRFAGDPACCADLSRNNGMIHLLRTRVFMLAVAIAFFAGPNSLPAADQRTPVAVLPLPESFTSEVTRQSRALAASIARDLESAGLRAIVPEATKPHSLEELTLIADSSSVAVALGVRSLGVSDPCSLVVPPKAIPRPPEADQPVSEEALGPVFRALVAHNRSAASARLADALLSAGGWCRARGTETEQYLLEGTDAPTVVLAVAPENEPGAVNSIRTAITAWLAAERERGRTTMGWSRRGALFEGP
jgi:hypothetical protein